MKKYIALLVLICAHEAQASKKSKTKTPKTSNQTQSFTQKLHEEIWTSDKFGNVLVVSLQEEIPAQQHDKETKLLTEIARLENALLLDGVPQDEIDGMRRSRFEANQQMHVAEEAFRSSQIQALAASHGLTAKRISQVPLNELLPNESEQILIEETVRKLTNAQREAEKARILARYKPITFHQFSRKPFKECKKNLHTKLLEECEKDLHTKTIIQSEPSNEDISKKTISKQRNKAKKQSACNA